MIALRACLTFDTIVIHKDENRFPDGTLALKDIDPRYNEILWLYEDDSELFTLMCLREHFCYSPTLILPYVPNARMDRVENENEVFTLKTFCNAINNMNFRRVIVYDTHSNVTSALLNNVEVMNPKCFIEKALDSIPEKDVLLFYPDEGAMKRYSKLFQREFAFGVKHRDWKTGQIKSLSIMTQNPIEGKTVLIVDDICSRGGTFLHSANLLRESGAKNIYLYVTHCENTILKGTMIHIDSLIQRIFTTDSICKCEHEKLKCIYSFKESFLKGHLF
ncbi:MAG: ribose-phosphate pyrophosphokinase [Lachnospiraceae bacterium]|nr:ribose-phosphate pyrophosphokinase [Lachnospiraceae bacterium]